LIGVAVPAEPWPTGAAFAPNCAVPTAASAAVTTAAATAA
jgi:hypothetical protein